MKKLVTPFIFFSLFIIGLYSCRKDFTTIENFGNLTFSKDTVYLDTIFSTISSPTYSLKVYNRGDKTISIPKIHLENGIQSNYRLNIDGIVRKEYQNIEILANDSIYVFIEATINSDKINNPLYTDKLIFENGNGKQHVNLVTLVKDAIFIYPNKIGKSKIIDSLTLDKKPTSIRGRILADNELVFNNKKPYVIYGYAAVPPKKTLIIEKGSNIYFHNNSGIIVDKNASIKINGTLNEKVTFQGDRLEHFYDKTPGQWGTIWLRAGSKNNEINYAQIKNATIGILADSITSKTIPTLKVTNSEIYNSGSFGLLGRQTSIEGANLVIANSGSSCFSGTFGGSFNFTHCTFANFSKNRKSGAVATVIINNFNNNSNKETQINSVEKANFTNCIIDGNNPVEFILQNKNNTSLFNYKVKNCLIRFNDPNKTYQNKLLNFNDTSHYQNNIINGKSDFKAPLLNNFNIGKQSNAIGKAIKSNYPIDLSGKNRTKRPDVGAYQYFISE